ncbi:hypothetical protein AB1Y20_018427 [Prymnesium parvum]|uniref:PDZ domain-containing protein n=1 Tax=Prymnesium parvum TaxID=97485 RepID=A0AB34JP77_PRYPA
MRLSLRAAPPGVSCCACRPRAASSAVVWSLVYLANGLILGVGFANHSTAACGAAFVATAIALVIHLVRASLTRQLHPLRLIVGFNVVVLAAASLSRERLSTQALSSIVVGIPLLSYYGFWGAALVLAPPRADEALKPPKELRECHPFNQLTVGVVLLVEFVQFNFLAFNPALGAWQEVHSLTESYRSVFLEVSEVQFDELLWVYCALALGWIIFAILVILILARWSDHTVLARLPTGGPDFSGLIGEEQEGPMPLHGPPVWRVMIFIGYWGRSAILLHRQRLVRWKTAAWHVAWGTRNLSPAPLALLGMVALVFMSGFFVFGTALATFMLMAAITLCCLAGLALCGAFAFITLFHFPIVMNIFASLHCTYDSAGEAGTMQRMPSQACWHGRHWHFVLVAVPILLVIYPLMIYFERKRLSGAEVSHHVHFTARILIGKLALSAASTLLVRESPSIYLLFCVGMLTFFLHVNNQREQDDQPASCNVRSVRLSRSMLITCALWTCCVTLGSQVLEVPEYALLSALGGLWLLTCMFFGALIVFPQHEPQYLSSDAHVSASVPLPRSSKGKETSTPQQKGTGSGGLPAQTPSVRDTPPSPRGMYATHISSGDRAAIRKEAGGSVTSPPVAAASRGMGGRGLQNASLLRMPAHASKAICFGSPEVVGSSTRTVRLPSALAARSRVTFFGYDDGFESVSNFDSEEADRSADACDLLPIVMATQRSSGFGQQLLNVSGGGVLSPIKRSRKDDELRPLDTIVSFNGVTGLGAAEIAERLEADSGPIELVVQRAQLRGGGTKRGPPIGSLGDMHILSCTDDKRAEVLAEIQHCAVLPVIVNAMEVGFPDVLDTNSSFIMN